MPAFLAPLAISAASAIGGWLANRKKQMEQQQLSTQNINQLTMPEYDEKTAILRDRLINMLLSNAESTDDFMSGYEAEGLKNINKSSEVQSRLLDSLLSSRGLRRTGMAGNAMFGNEVNRLNQQSSFLNNIPLLRDQLSRQRIGEAAGFFSQIPKGARTTGTTTGTSTGTMIDPGNPLAGGISNLGATLAYFYGNGAFGGGKNPQTPATNQNFLQNSGGYQPYDFYSQSYFDPRRYNLASPIR